MEKTLGLMVMVAAMAWTSATFAQVPAGAPAGTTGLCKDGSYVSADTKKGACKGHKGVKDWYAAAPAAAAAGAPAAAAPAAAAPAGSTAAGSSAAAPSAAAPAAAAPAPMAPAASATSKSKSAMAPGAVAPGGGPGQVWANLSSKVYHCMGTKYYGTTKNGAYMTEADAKAKGMHADHGKACTS